MVWADCGASLVVSVCLVVLPGVVDSGCLVVLPGVVDSGHLVVLPGAVDSGPGFVVMVAVVLLPLVVGFDVDGGSGFGASDSLACMK